MVPEYPATSDVAQMDAIQTLTAPLNATLAITMLGVNQFGVASLVIPLALLQGALEVMLRTVLVVTLLGRDLALVQINVKPAMRPVLTVLTRTRALNVVANGTPLFELMTRMTGVLKRALMAPMETQTVFVRTAIVLVRHVLDHSTPIVQDVGTGQHLIRLEFNMPS